MYEEETLRYLLLLEVYEKRLALAALGSVTFCLHPWEPFVLGSPCPSERCAEGQQIEVSKKA